MLYDEAVAELLQAAGIGLLQNTLYYGPRRPDPATGVWVLATGGQRAAGYSGADSELSDRPVAFEIYIRWQTLSSQDDYRAACDWLGQIWLALENATPTGAIAGSGYCSQAWPVYLGTNPNGCHEWRLNYNCVFAQ